MHQFVHTDVMHFKLPTQGLIVCLQVTENTFIGPPCLTIGQSNTFTGPSCWTTGHG
jgi:hypothetical protein